ncbi:MAG: hypothetical protein ACK559_00140, partial [bacterium]
MTDHARRIADRDRVGRHVARDDRTGADPRAMPDGDAGEDHRARADPHVAADRDAAAGHGVAVARFGREQQRPERIGGRQIRRMIGLSEDQDLRSDRAEIPDRDRGIGGRSHEAARRGAIAVASDLDMGGKTRAAFATKHPADQA